MRSDIFGLHDREYVRKSGAGMTGPLVLSGVPNQAGQASNKVYVDAREAESGVYAQALIDELNSRLFAVDGVLDRRFMNVLGDMPGLYGRGYDDIWATAGAAGAQRYTIISPESLAIWIDGKVYFIRNNYTLDLSSAAVWDATAPTDYTIAANRAGVDFYIYACQPATGQGAVILMSANAVAPVGYTILNSRRIGGFHCLCVNVGVIAGHPLTGFLAGDVLPASIWDCKHRPECEPEGMVYSDDADLWVDIYLPSGVGAATASVYGGVISDNRSWMDFVDDGGAVLKRLLADPEFSVIAAGGNEETNIAGGADPGTTGGHVDTAGRRMISHCGCEDCCGVSSQWIQGESAYLDAADVHAHTFTITHKAIPTGSVVQKDQLETNLNANLGSGADETVNSSNVDPAPGWGWLNLPGPARGSLWRQGNSQSVKLNAGGGWNGGLAAGSRARGINTRITTLNLISARFGCARRR